MLRPKYIERLPAGMVELYSQAEVDILVDMARRISAYDYFIPAAQWQYQKLVEMGNYHSYILEALSSLTGRTRKELETLMEEAGQKALSFDDRIYRRAGLDPPPLAASPMLQEVLEAGLRNTGGLFDNLTRTTAATATKQFEHALDRAYLKITTGGFDYNASIRSAIKELAKKGLASAEYPGGHMDYLETAVRRAVVTGVNQTALKLQEARAEEMGSDLVETTAHSGARPSHAEWQGKVFSRSGSHPKYPPFVESTGYGTGAGLGGWNCRHSFFPFFEGISEPAYTAKELQEMDAPRYTYDGEQLTEYEASQRQRYLERQVRRWKREYKAMEAAGQPTEEAASKLAAWRGREKDFLHRTELKPQNERSQVAGFGRGEAARASVQARRPVLTNAAGQRIIKVNHTDLTGEANTITQRVNSGGNIDRNYYNEDGKQVKQVSSTHHNHKPVMGYGNHGEHAHDYIYDGEGKLTERPYRELTEAERKENADIL